MLFYRNIVPRRLTSVSFIYALPSKTRVYSSNTHRYSATDDDAHHSVNPTRELKTNFARGSIYHVAAELRSSSNEKSTTIPGENVSIRLKKWSNSWKIVATVQIVNPSKLNVLHSRLIQNLTTAFEDLSQEKSIQCIILQGALDRGGEQHPRAKSPSFCAGADLSTMYAIKNSTDAETFIRSVSTLCSAIRSCPVPVIAAINGHCYGAGLEVAASCDVRYATAISKFAMPEVKVGIPSVVEARLLVDIVGWANTRYLTLFGTTIDCARASQMGLVNEVFSSEDEMASRINEDLESLSSASIEAVKSQKALMRRWEDCDLRTGIEEGVKSFAAMWQDGGREPRFCMRRTLLRLGNVSKDKSTHQCIFQKD